MLKFRKKNVDLIGATIFFIFGSIVIFLVVNAFFNGKLFYNTGANVFHDHYVHLFSMLDKTQYPGAHGYLIFPPFIYLIYSLILHQDAVSLNMSGDFLDIVLNKPIPPSSFYITALFFIAVFICLFFMIYIFLCNYTNNMLISFMFSLSICFSYPMLQSLEAGNPVVLALLTLLIFLYLYNTNNRTMNLLSLLFLSFSFGIKFYPAIFGFLLVTDRKIKKCIIACVLGLLVLIIPCFFFEGFSTIPKIVNTLISFNNCTLFSHLGIYKVIDRTFNFLFGIDYAHNLFLLHLTQKAILISCIILTALSKRFSDKVFFLSYICVNYDINHFSYNYVYYIIPFIYFIGENRNINFEHKISPYDFVNIFIFLSYMLIFMVYNNEYLHIIPTGLLLILYVVKIFLQNDGINVLNK